MYVVFLISSPILFKLLTLNRKGFVAIAIFPFMVTKIPKSKIHKTLINHERIHFRQQIELLIIGFYITYGFEFLIGLVKYKDWDLAYKSISFELEAFQNEKNLDYLKQRKIFAQWRND